MNPGMALNVYIYSAQNNYYYKDLQRFLMKNWPILIKRLEMWGRESEREKRRERE